MRTRKKTLYVVYENYDSNDSRVGPSRVDMYTLTDPSEKIKISLDLESFENWPKKESTSRILPVDEAKKFTSCPNVFSYVGAHTASLGRRS